MSSGDIRSECSAAIPSRGCAWTCSSRSVLISSHAVTIPVAAHIGHETRPLLHDGHRAAPCPRQPGQFFIPRCPATRPEPPHCPHPTRAVPRHVAHATFVSP